MDTGASTTQSSLGVASLLALYAQALKPLALASIQLCTASKYGKFFLVYYSGIIVNAWFI